MTSLPLVSIIIPCYNSATYVGDAIQSAIDQTYSNCQIIVINDGSTDGSLEVVRQFGSSIQLIDQPNRGRSAARNVGLDQARGEFIKLLDADDKLSNDCLSLQVDAMGNGPIWNEAATLMFENEVPPSIPYPVCLPEMDLWRRLLAKGGLPMCAPLVRTSALRSIRFPENVAYGEDTVFWSDLWVHLGRPQRIPFVEQAQCFVRKHAGQCTASPHPDDPLRGTLILLESWADDLLRSDEVCDAALERLSERVSTAIRRGCKNKDLLYRTQHLVCRLCEVRGLDSARALSNLNRVISINRWNSRYHRIRSSMKRLIARVGGHKLVYFFRRQ